MKIIISLIGLFFVLNVNQPVMAEVHDCGSGNIARVRQEISEVQVIPKCGNVKVDDDGVYINNQPLRDIHEKLTACKQGQAYGCRVVNPQEEFKVESVMEVIDPRGNKTVLRLVPNVPHVPHACAIVPENDNLVMSNLRLNPDTNKPVVADEHDFECRSPLSN